MLGTCQCEIWLWLQGPGIFVGFVASRVCVARGSSVINFKEFAYGQLSPELLHTRTNVWANLGVAYFRCLQRQNEAKASLQQPGTSSIISSLRICPSAGVTSTSNSKQT